ncbi:MAG: response regulator [Gemmatimonadaceae bacterium]
MPTSPSTDPSGASTEDLGGALQALREHFRASSGPMVDTFETLAAQLTRSPDSPRALEGLRRELHRVKGTAGSYGFLDASALAAKLEERVAAWANDPALERDTRANVIRHFGSAIKLAFQAPVAADRLPALAAGPRRRMLLVGWPQAAVSAFGEEAARRGYLLEAMASEQLSDELLRERMPHIVVVPSSHAQHRANGGRAHWVPTLEIDVTGVATLDVRALLDRADALLLATTWLRPTVLLLDDDPSILEIARYALGGELRVVTLDTPLHVFETLEREQPVVLLFEARLPEFDAIAFARMLRTMPPYRDLPILLLGGNLDSATRLAAYDAGVDETLTKPLIPLELRARVAQRLERLRVDRLTSGVHAMTAIALPPRLREAIESYQALTSAGRRATCVLVRPRAQSADPAHTVAWLRESRRLTRAIGATARFAGYRDDLAMLLVLDAPPALATRLMESLTLNKPGEAPEWASVSDEGNGPEGFLGP